MSIAIQVENVSKQYRLGKVGTGTIVHDINRWWHLARGKEDPYLKIGEANDRAKKGESDYVWALRDVNFEIEQGEAVGIIGRNGAGKSTLLKILSRTTAPTTGNLRLRGRVASLLEVGTGFHPELSGRENIFLNGAILGMTRKEITRKFDEIVDFSGVERYIDTPVKRYSSGMYVRLAFAVAAHLESEILIVDEVLAVGDAEFQKKCLGKMGEVSKGEGRTVLFVSHNMQAVSNLCQSAILLDQGTISMNSNVSDCIKSYYVSLQQNNLLTSSLDNRTNRTTGSVLFEDISILNKVKSAWEFSVNEQIDFHFRVLVKENVDSLLFYFALIHPHSNEIITNFKKVISESNLYVGDELDIVFSIPPFCLRPNNFSLYFALGNKEASLFFDVIDNNVNLPFLKINPIDYDTQNNVGFVSVSFNLNVLNSIEK